MSDVTRDDLQAVLARLNKAEEFQNEVRPIMWLVTAVKGLAIAFGVFAVGGLIAFVYAWGAFNTKVAEHDRRLDRIEEKLERLSDRIPPRVVASLAYDGKILKISDDVFTIRTEGPEAKEITFALDQDTTITIGDRAALAGNLKPGMKVKVTEGEKGKAALIEAPNAKLPPPPKDVRP